MSGLKQQVVASLMITDPFVCYLLTSAPRDYKDGLEDAWVGRVLSTMHHDKDSFPFHVLSVKLR
jgi:hypothetical protein